MTGVHIDSSQIQDLAADYERIPGEAERKTSKAAEKAARDGNRLATSFARESSGAHGKWYPDDFTVDGHGASWAYGPEPSRPQGGMSFEFGSRNQPPHLDLAKSADVVGPNLQRRVGEAIDECFSGN